MFSGLDQLLDENRISELTLLHNLCSRVKDGLKLLRQEFAAYIKVGLIFFLVGGGGGGGGNQMEKLDLIQMVIYIFIISVLR